MIHDPLMLSFKNPVIAGDSGLGKSRHERAKDAWERRMNKDKQSQSSVIMMTPIKPVLVFVNQEPSKKYA